MATVGLIDNISESSINGTIVSIGFAKEFQA